MNHEIANIAADDAPAALSPSDQRVVDEAVTWLNTTVNRSGLDLAVEVRTYILDRFFEGSYESLPYAVVITPEVSVHRSLSGIALVFGFAAALAACSSDEDFGVGGASTKPWAKRFSAAIGGSVAVDGHGNVCTTGGTGGTTDFGGGALTPGDDRNGDGILFVACFDSEGRHRWSKGFDDRADYAVAFDAAGNVYVGGQTNGRVDFGGGPLTAEEGIAVVSFDSNGGHRWSKALAGGSYPQRGVIAVDSSGNIYTAGTFQGTLDFGDFGGGALSAEGEDFFAASFDSQGMHRWSRRFELTSEQRGNVGAFTVDGNGHMYVTGSFGGTVDFGGGPLTSSGQDEIFLASFKTDGTHRWSKNFSNSGGSGTAIAADSHGNVFITGHASYMADFGGGPLLPPDGIFLASFETDGTHRWSKRIGEELSWDEDAGWAILHAIAVDPSGNVYATGEFRATFDFGGGPITSAGSDDIFLVSYDTAGAHRWSKRYGSQQDFHDIAYAVAIGQSGNVYLTGALVGTVDFGTGPLPGPDEAESFDMFLAKLPRNP